ncbi:hypothetical protein AQB9606_04653 [Aquabacterium sp. CECT 9606]|nr:hypothetical protein AQB9606_04653 [Aquabacterium sp. CECT 9606]
MLVPVVVAAKDSSTPSSGLAIVAVMLVRLVVDPPEMVASVSAILRGVCSVKAPV